MRYRIHAAFFAFCLTLYPQLANAQDMAVSWEDLPRVLKPGNVIYVTETTGVRTLGTVTHVSTSSVTVALTRVDREKETTKVTVGQERTFEDNLIDRINRSDKVGKEQALVYPPSWDKADSLPQGTKLTILLKNGEKRRYQFRGITSGNLELTGALGRDETLAKNDIQRIVRRNVNDSTINGLALGAAISGGTSAFFTTLFLASCGFDCGTGPDGPVIAATAGMMAAIGAGVGWTIDKVHKGTDEVFPAPPTHALRVDIVPLAGAGKAGAKVTLRF